MATQIGTVIDGKYEILKQIGKGGMSTVYLAMDKRLNKQWAVKEISRKGFGKNNEEIVNEVPADAEMMKALDHPAIPTIVDIIDHRDNEFIYVVMDYVEGESLDKVLAEYGAQSQDMVIDWAKQICDAFSYLHSQKPPIIYRDMKPANVMLKPEGNIKIIDFGIAREYKEGNLADTTVLGTKGYASPEHYGGRQTDERSDIYTLGMTMHHLLTGVDPRPADYIYAPIRQWNPELSGGLERIIDKCVSPDPKDRYQNCNELLYALDHYTEEEDSFKKKQKRKLASFVVSISLAVIFAVSGVVTYNLATNAKNNNYDALVQLSGQDYETVVENINKAISINSKSLDAYKVFLNYIVNENKEEGQKNITKTEMSGLKTFYNVLKRQYIVNDNESYNYQDSNNVYYYFDEEFAMFSYELGIELFSFYNCNEDSSLMERAQISKEIFNTVKDVDFQEKKMVQNFNNICKFYDDTDKNSTNTPNYETLYADMISTLTSVVEEIDEYKSIDTDNDNSIFIKLTIYKSSLDYINSYKTSMAKFGKVD